MGSATEKTSYLDPPQLVGRPNNDGTISITPLELKKLNDFNYSVAQMIQGGLNLANLNKATNEVFNGMVTFTDLSTGGSTTINGDNITTGTISAERISTDIAQVNKAVNIGAIGDNSNKSIVFTGGSALINDYDGYGGVPLLTITAAATAVTNLLTSGNIENYNNLFPIRIISNGANLSIDSDGTIYIGTNASHSGNVSIGKPGGNIYLSGNVYINGVLQ